MTRRDLVIEFRWSDGITERLPVLARELLALNPEVLVTATQVGAEALKAATSTVPVVFISVSSPDTQGFVASLARPGGNMTGIAFRGRDSTPSWPKSFVKSCRRQSGLPCWILPAIRAGKETGRTSSACSPRAVSNWRQLFRSAAQGTSRRPTPGSRRKGPKWFGRCRTRCSSPMRASSANSRGRRAFANAGGLLSFDSVLGEEYRRAASYVDRILKGAKPADLPVEQPDRFHLAVNLRSAKALGIRIPQSVLLRADEVIG